MNYDKLWEILVNKAHVAIAVIFQAGVLVWHHVTGRDLGLNVTQSLTSFYMFLAGHFVSSQVWPDKPPTPKPDNPDQN